MPVPPALFVLGGPKLMAAKTMAYEMLPAVTSAAVAVILARLLWKLLPDWVKDDVQFRSNSSESSSDVERLAAVLDRIQMWIKSNHARNKVVDSIKMGPPNPRRKCPSDEIFYVADETFIDTFVCGLGKTEKQLHFLRQNAVSPTRPHTYPSAVIGDVNAGDRVAAVATL